MTVGEWTRLWQERRDCAAVELHAAALAASRRKARASAPPSSDAEDLAQRAVLAVLSGEADFGRASPAVELDAWVRGVVANMARTDARRRLVEARPGASRHPGIERRAAVARERAAILSRFSADALRSLTDRQHFAVRRWAEGASFAAIGARLVVRGDTARDLVHRGLDAARRVDAGGPVAQRATVPVRYPPLATVSRLALTPRQLAVYALAAAGRTLNRIAQSMHVCREAVRSMLRRVWRRLASFTGAGEATSTPQESRDRKVEQSPFETEAAMMSVADPVREPKRAAWAQNGQTWARPWTPAPAPSAAARRRPWGSRAAATDPAGTWTTSSGVALPDAPPRVNAFAAVGAATPAVLVLVWAT